MPILLAILPWLTVGTVAIITEKDIKKALEDRPPENFISGILNKLLLLTSIVFIIIAVLYKRKK